MWGHMLKLIREFIRWYEIFDKKFNNINIRRNKRMKYLENIYHRWRRSCPAVVPTIQSFHSSFDIPYYQVLFLHVQHDDGMCGVGYAYPSEEAAMTSGCWWSSCCKAWSFIYCVLYFFFRFVFAWNYQLVFDLSVWISLCIFPISFSC